MNNGGSRKTVSSAYGNISGSRKQIHPSSIVYTYTWKKYNSVSSTSNNETTTAYTLYDQQLDYTVWTVSSYTVVNNYFSNVSSSFLGYVGNLSSIPGVNFYIQGNADVGSTIVYNMYKGPATIVKSGEVEIGENNYADIFQINCYKVSVTTSTTYSCGSTYYGTVSSTSSSTYPSNGRHSDGYWYIYQGRS